MNIVWAVDGSEHAFAAVDMLCDLPPAEGGTVSALAVVSPRRAYQENRLLDALEETDLRFRQRNLTVETELLYGDPAEALVDYAADHKPDLIVMGAKGLRATLGILLGGVAQQVVEYAHCPVLIVRSPYIGLQRVLLVSDGSEHSKHAASFLVDFALPEDTKLDVVRVLPPLPTPEEVVRSWGLRIYAVNEATIAEVREGLKQRAEEEARKEEKALDTEVRRLAERGRKAQAVLLRGDAATEILAYAREHQANLIVSGSRGLSRVRAWLLGSVSRKLVHYADCSVLIVK
jgi:nucleotide-binding universal stress UspA family protein